MKFNLALYFFFQSKPDIKNINYPICKENTEFDKRHTSTLSKCEFFEEKIL